MQSWVPVADIKISLSDKKHLYERNSYTIMNLLADLGGFQGAIIMIPYPLMSLYSSHMLRRSLTNQTPAIRKNKDKKRGLKKKHSNAG